MLYAYTRAWKCMFLFTIKRNITWDSHISYFSISFGEVTTLLTAEAFVYHIEVDLIDSESLVFSDSCALKLADRNSTSPIAGSAKQGGYREGAASVARFNYIPTFTQLNETHIVVADYGNHCLRLLIRSTTSITHPLAGKCENAGFSDGTNSRFFNPFSVIKDKGFSTRLIVTDKKNNALRVFCLVSRITETISHSGLNFPTGIAYDIQGEYLLITNRHYTSKYSLKSRSLTNLTGGIYPGYKDGPLCSAKYYELKAIIFITSTLFLVADRHNNRLRFIDIEQDSVSSICTGEETTRDASARDCSFDKPHALLLKKNLIYIGQWRAIRSLTCRHIYCNIFDPVIE